MVPFWQLVDGECQLLNETLCDGEPAARWLDNTTTSWRYFELISSQEVRIINNSYQIINKLPRSHMAYSRMPALRKCSLVSCGVFAGLAIWIVVVDSSLGLLTTEDYFLGFRRSIRWTGHVNSGSRFFSGAPDHRRLLFRFQAECSLGWACE